MVAATGGPLTMMGGYAGVLQGARRWSWLAATYVANGLGRLAAGGLALLLHHSVAAAMVGLAIGSAAPAIVGWFGCRAVPHGATGRHLPTLTEVWHNGHSLLAFFALTNLDILLARNLFSHLDSGVYAAGAVLAKTCLFLPQFVIVVAFPAMAEDQAHDSSDRAWLKPLGLVAALGAMAVLGVAVLRDLAVTFVGGDEYAALADYAWLFALEGTAFALLQLLVYRQIARQAHVAVFLWASVLTVTALALGLVDTNRELVVAVIAAVVLVALPLALARPSGRAVMARPAIPGPDHSPG
jgi:O-antigen/teichoic acid export membrane protein